MTDGSDCDDTDFCGDPLLELDDCDDADLGVDDLVEDTSDESDDDDSDLEADATEPNGLMLVMTQLWSLWFAVDDDRFVSMGRCTFVHGREF